MKDGNANSHGLPDSVWPATARADLSATAETCRPRICAFIRKLSKGG